MQYDVLIVGAGMTGAVAARCLAESGAKVLVIDARGHTGGNCHDMPDNNGVLIHPYGPHIFHTSRQDVVDFLSRFTTWRPYEHRVVALVNNRFVPLPFNLTSVELCFPGAAGQKLTKLLIDVFGYGAQVPILQLRHAPQPELAELAAFVYENIFVGYTRKQWGLPPDCIDPAITGRVPVRISHDDRYFQDSFQHMPAKGYHALFTALLDHCHIQVRTNTAFSDLDAETSWKHCVYTGPLDEYFTGEQGWLPYRSLDFVFEHYQQHRHQPVAVVNYPDFSVPFTRISEYRILTGQNSSQADLQSGGLGTSVSLEYPCPHVPGQTIPYYPVLTQDSTALLKRYQARARAEAPNIVFAGRLGAFRYMNMDEAVAAAFAAVQQIV